MSAAAFTPDGNSFIIGGDEGLATLDTARLLNAWKRQKTDEIHSSSDLDFLDTLIDGSQRASPTFLIPTAVLTLPSHRLASTT